MTTTQENISLKPYNTFGIDVKAKQFVSVDSASELADILANNKEKEFFVLGGGSNILLTKDVDALVIHNNLKGIEIHSQNDQTATVKVAAGENWHDFVMWCIENNFGGVENLSLIPGNVGTAPIQNIGAYGVELKDVFVSCDAIEIETQKIKTFTKDDCDFDYRYSVFKGDLKGKCIITSVTLKLSTNNHKLNTSYGVINEELKKLNTQQYTIKNVSDAVIKIRQSKLPDPAQIGNSGSFFKNPIVSASHFKRLESHFKDLPFYKISEDAYKIPAGWLIETAGFKGKRFQNYGVHEKQALVLVNYGGAKGGDIYKLAATIKDTIYRLFDIKLEFEVNIL